MYFVEDSLDDLMRTVFSTIMEKGEVVVPSKGPTRELFGVVLELRNPRCRLSLTEMKGRIYSALGELVWYLAGAEDSDFIEFYLKGYTPEPGTKKVWGAYGPRMFKMRGHTNQISNVQNLLKQRPTTRQAVIQLFNAEDIASDHEDVPCTCLLQFALRKTGLDLFVTMRSNDAYRGLPHDIFAFTMLQEVVARELGVSVGRYKHAVGSLHLYDTTVEAAKAFLDEGYHEPIQMPEMPLGSQWAEIDTVLKVEPEIRGGKELDASSLGLSPYWTDIVRLLQVYALSRGDEVLKNETVLHSISSQVDPYFRIYVSDRIKSRMQAVEQ